MERIVELFSELQKEFVAFIERTNHELSTPRCDFECSHCNRGTHREENLEESRYSGGEAYSPEDDDEDDDQRFEQSEIQISEVIENYPDASHINDESTKNDDTNSSFILPGKDEVPEEMTISEDSLTLEEDQIGDDGDAEAEKENEIESEEQVAGDARDREWHSFHEGTSKRAATIEQRTCQYCDRIFPFPYLVKRHEAVHTGSTPFKCIGCKRCYSHRQSLYKHKLECPDAALTCCQCGVQFNTSKKLKQHIIQAHGFKRGPTKHNDHEANEANAPKASKVPKVPKAAKAPNDAKPARKLKCEICRRMFSNNSALSKHMTVHSGTQRFECTECGKKYSYMERIKSHYKNHHPGVPFA